MKTSGLGKRLKAAGRALLGRPIAKVRFPEITGVSAADTAIAERVHPYSMTGLPRIVALLDAVEYVVRRGIPGAFAECGVWRGGSVLAMVLKLQQLGADDRDLYLFDTFEGMTQPSARDTSPFERPAAATWEQARSRGERGWGQLFDPETFNEGAVRELLVSTGYSPGRLHFVKGPVEQTIPRQAPAGIALLRLDTDWYASTRHEMVHLYPRIVSGGVLIVDDYGHWEGCQRAVDEFLSSTPAAAPLLHRIDYSARIAIKP